MNVRSRIAAAAITATALAAPLLATAQPADAAPAQTGPAQHSATQAAKAHHFGDTVTVDGFKIKVTHHRDQKSGKHFTEDIDLRVTPTKHHKKWTPADGWDQRLRYGKHNQHKPTLVGGQGFSTERPWVAGGRWSVGTKHHAKHLQYTMTFRGHKITWTNA